MTENLKRMSPNDRLDYLQTHADSIVEDYYFQPFGMEETQQTQADLSDLAMKIEVKNDELKDIKDTYKSAMKKLVADYKNALQNLKQQGERIFGKLYLFADQETKMMCYYDATGHLVSSRRLKPEERQLNILSLNQKTA